MIILDGIAILRKVSYLLNQATEVLLDLNPSYLILAVSIYFSTDVFFSLHQCIFDISPRSIPHGE